MLLPALSLPVAGLLLAFVAHGAVAALLLRPGHGRQLARAVGLACVFTALGAVVSVLTQPGVYDAPRLSGLVDALRFAAWLHVLRVVAASPAFLVRAGWGACGAFALVVLLVPAPELAVALRAGSLLLTLLSLAVLVSLWLGAGSAPRETLAPLLAGIGVPLAFECALQAFDSRSLDGLGWLAALQTVSLPLVLMGIRRVSATVPMAFVSRQVVLFTLALVAVAAYLALTSMAASAIAAADESPAHWHEIAFLAAAAVLFGVLCAAPSVRRRVGVFVATHFYRNKYDYRVEWLRFIQTLSSGSDQCRAFDVDPRGGADVRLPGGRAVRA